MHDILARVMELDPGFTEDMARSVEATVRRDWGGARVYVPKERVALARVNAQRKREADARRQQVQADAARGTTIEVMERSHGITRRTIYRLLKR